MRDIYFEPNYGKVYEQLGEGISHEFIYSDEYVEISNMFIIRDIPDGIFNGKGVVFYENISKMVN